jgi:SAM-dependent methyltransferase
MSVEAVEPMAAGARNARRRGIEAVVCGRFESLQLPDHSLPAIGCFDVLEHIDRPEELVCEFMRVLRPGGLFVATVPALNWLWSDADVLAGHFRRYTRYSLRNLAASVGFETEHVDYFMMSLVIPMFVMRTLPSKLRQGGLSKESIQRHMNDPGNRSSRSPIELLLRMEAAAARLLPLPMGTSVIGVLRKPRELDSKGA